MIEEDSETRSLFTCWKRALAAGVITRSFPTLNSMPGLKMKRLLFLSKLLLNVSLGISYLPAALLLYVFISSFSWLYSYLPVVRSVIFFAIGSLELNLTFPSILGKCSFLNCEYKLSKAEG